MSLEPRRDEQLGRACRVWAFANSSEINGNPLSLESPLHDLSLDPRLGPEHRYEVFSHRSSMSPCIAKCASTRQPAAPHEVGPAIGGPGWCRVCSRDGCGRRCAWLSSPSPSASRSARKGKRTAFGPEWDCRRSVLPLPGLRFAWPEPKAHPADRATHVVLVGEAGG